MVYIVFMILKGEVKDIIFRNNENGYTILEIGQGMVSSIATGKFPVVGVGEEVELEGSYEVNPRYGKQFVANSIKISAFFSVFVCNSFVIKFLGFL